MMSSLLIHTYRVVYRLVQLFLHLGKCQCQRSHNQAYLKHWTYLESGHWFRGWIPGEWNTISAYILGFVVYGSVKTSRKFVLFVWTTVEKLPCWICAFISQEACFLDSALIIFQVSMLENLWVRRNLTSSCSDTRLNYLELLTSPEK